MVFFFIYSDFPFVYNPDVNEEDDYAGIYLGANFIPSMQIMCRESRLFLPSFQPGARGERENELYAGVVKKFTSKHIANYEISDILDHEVGHHHYCCSVRVFKTRSVCRPLQKKKNIFVSHLFFLPGGSATMEYSR